MCWYKYDYSKIYESKTISCFTILLECNLKTDGQRRIQKTYLTFGLYEVCRNGDWLKEACESGALFWTVLDCCVPLAKYPARKNCIATNNQKTHLIDIDAKSYLIDHVDSLYMSGSIKYH